jgi:SpoVK/Ycf46/Vps4 family AAA+-type ATPase
MTKCNQCQTPNRDSARFCKRCGKPLAIPKEQELEGLFAKDNLFDTLKEFLKRIDVDRQMKERGNRVHIQMDCVILGQAGTGKHFMAELLTDWLVRNEVVYQSEVKVLDASDFPSWIDKIDENLNAIKDGLLVLHNAQKLIYNGESQELDLLFTRMHDNPTTMPIVIMTGLQRDMEEFLAAKPEIASLFEFRYDLKTFDEKTLCDVTAHILKKRYKFDITPEALKKLEGHYEWLMRKVGIANNGLLAEKKAEEMAVNALLRAGKTIEERDVRGEVFVPRTEAEIWAELDEFIGLQSVKDEIHKIIDSIKEAQREGGTARIKDHFIFSGNPGTGKTTIARIFADILGATGVLPKGQYVEVAAKDLISEYVGGTEHNVQDYVDRAMGGVLFIDEAYGFNDGNFGKAGIDKLVPILENKKGEFVCIAAGYRDNMKAFLKMNTGLPSRFNKQIEFPDYDAKELELIFLSMAKKKGFRLDQEATEKLHIEFENMYNRRGDTFGNARDVRNLLDIAIERRRIRHRTMSEEEIAREGKLLMYSDIAGEGVNKVLDIQEVMKELDELVGLESVKRSLRDLAATIRREQQLAQKRNRTPNINVSHYLFLGNPGTGKTTVARLMGQILHSLGVISSPQVYEVTREDLVSRYLGETAHLTRETVMKAMGAVLFIDEAYSLNSGGPHDYGSEAINTLTPLLENYKGKFVCIAAGYTRDMIEFLNMNRGLRSRFDETIYFDDYNVDELLQIFLSMATKKEFRLDDKAIAAARSLFEKAYAQRDENFGNARTVRKALDRAIKNLSSRTAYDDTLSEEALMTLTADDLKTIELEDIL